MRILVVEDEPAIASLLAAACARDGHAVTAVTSPIRALELAQQARFDLLITDIVMPGLDGLSLVRRLRAMQPALTALAITGYAGRNTRADVLEAGGVELVEKPFSLAELRRQIAHSMAA